MSTWTGPRGYRLETVSGEVLALHRTYRWVREQLIRLRPMEFRIVMIQGEAHKTPYVGREVYHVYWTGKKFKHEVMR